MSVDPVTPDAHRSLTSWRLDAQDRLVQLRHTVARRTAEAPAPDPATLQQIAADLHQATSAVNCEHGRHPVTAFRDWLNGTERETAWRSLHRAEVGILRLQPEDALREEARRLRSALDRPKPDEGTAFQIGELHRIAEANRQLTPVERESVCRARQDLAHLRDEAYRRQRTLRNLLYGAALLLGVAVVAVGVAGGAVDPLGLSICGPVSADQPTASTCLAGATPRRGDLAEIELAGILGGLISAVFAVRRLPLESGPYGVPLSLAAMKVPMGAATAVLGIFLMQKGILAVLPPRAGSTLIAYALFFGVAQHIITRNIDSYALQLSPKANTG